MKRFIKVLCGLFIISTVLAGYLPIPEYIIELTCISNLLAGILLTADGLFNLKAKWKLTVIFYRIVCVTLMIVFIVCMVSLLGFYHMNFYDAFLFLHVINPIAFSLLYLMICNENSCSIKSTIFSPLFFMLYLLLDYVSGLVNGSFVYGFFNVDTMTFPTTLILGFAAYAFAYFIGLAIYTLNKRLWSNYDCDDQR